MYYPNSIVMILLRILYNLATNDALISQSSFTELSPTLSAEIAAIWSYYGIRLVILICFTGCIAYNNVKYWI